MPINDEINKKYELIKSDKTTPKGRPLFRVKAKMDIGYSIKKGDLGGYIEKEANLSVSGNAWLSGNAQVSGNARVSGDAQVSGNAWVSGDAQVSGDAWVSGNARVSGDAWVSIRADITTNIDFEIPRIKIDNEKKLDKLMKVLNELKT